MSEEKAEYVFSANNHGGEIDPDCKSMKSRHKELHQAFDELFACFITENPEKSNFLDTPLHEFMEWSHQMTLEATCESKNTKSEKTS